VIAEASARTSPKRPTADPPLPIAAPLSRETPRCARAPGAGYRAIRPGAGRSRAQRTRSRAPLRGPCEFVTGRLQASLGDRGLCRHLVLFRHLGDHVRVHAQQRLHGMPELGLRSRRSRARLHGSTGSQSCAQVIRDRSGHSDGPTTRPHRRYGSIRPTPATTHAGCHTRLRQLLYAV